VDSLAGRVVVVAGTEAILGPIASALQSAGASVAFVASAQLARTDVAVHFRTDPTDPDVWDRVSMHVEQHLGPVDAVVTDAGTAGTVRAAFAADLLRRGHGDVVVVEPDAVVADAVTKVVGTQR